MQAISPYLQNLISSESAGFSGSPQIKYTYGTSPSGDLVVKSATVSGYQVQQPATLVPFKADASPALSQSDLRKPEPLMLPSEMADVYDAYKLGGDPNLPSLNKYKMYDFATRMHEMLHFRAAGGIANGMELDYLQGPDGNFYAVGGRVEIKTTSNADEVTQKLQSLSYFNAANAPADASAADLSASRKALNILT